MPLRDFKLLVVLPYNEAAMLAAAALAVRSELMEEVREIEAGIGEDRRPLEYDAQLLASGAAKLMAAPDLNLVDVLAALEQLIDAGLPFEVLAAESLAPGDTPEGLVARANEILAQPPTPGRGPHFASVAFDYRNAAFVTAMKAARTALAASGLREEQNV